MAKKNHSSYDCSEHLREHTIEYLYRMKEKLDKRVNKTRKKCQKSYILVKMMTKKCSQIGTANNIQKLSACILFLCRLNGNVCKLGTHSLTHCIMAKSVFHCML